jgi:hypothetical protein
MDGDVLALDLSECKTNHKTCERPGCGNEFESRDGNGGSRQRFCSTECRKRFHAGDKGSQRPQRPQRPASVPKDAGEEFDCSDDDSIILREQPATAVYFNKEGSLVIRQHRWPDDDIFIYIAESSIGDFLDKLTDICGIPSFGGP